MIKNLTIITTLLCAFHSFAKTVRYELTIENQKVNVSGHKAVDFALMINKSIPAPTLEFTEGDDADIVVHNRLPKEETSIHWHGILLPPEMDGVSYVNTPPIHAGESFTFKFKVRQHGTYWYHSHTHVQEQKGLYGAIVIHPKNPNIHTTHDVALVLSDWSDENATAILKNLRKDGDYYLYKKKTMRSWLGALRAGALGTYLHNEWTRMGGMDYSDVGYDAFLINGQKSLQLPPVKSGDSVRLRLINAAASSYFYVSLGQAPMQVVSADGVDIEPILAQEILMGMAETYDVIFTVPENKNYELRVTAQDGTGFASAWIGEGEKVPAPVKPFPDLYASMSHHHDASHGGHDSHAHHGHDHAPSVIPTLTVDQLRAQSPTDFSPSLPRHEFKLVLNGDMERYIWHINGKAIHEERTIEIKEGEVVRFTFENKTMMHHPMHLHGHFFRVLTSSNERSPLKHTVDVPPHQTRTIEFLANEPGEWMLHCHNLYHLKTGMARVVKYLSFVPAKSVAAHQKHDPHLHDHTYYYGTLEAATHHAEGSLRASQTWNQYDLRVETRNAQGRNFRFNDQWELEGDLFYRRWTGRFLNFIGGATYFNENLRATLGIGYILPFLIEVQGFIDHTADIRLDVEKRFQWTKSIFTDADLTWRPKQSGDIEEPLEFEISLMYSPSWYWAAGLMLTEDTLGAGLEVQF